ncbi:hypothetical protein KY363_02245 [Candidatus Woesearchaeota archaeon]|nr:hypothetical protein [Candidatus Woesearchaeota archaeon]
MQEGFSRIRDAYLERHRRLVLEGRARRMTSRGYWAASDPDVIFELFTKLHLDTYRQFIDLGSGDGVVAAIASLFTHSTGIEADKALHESAGKIKDGLGLNHVLKNMDFLEEDLSAYDVIFMSPDNHFHLIEKKIIEEFKGVLVLTDNLFTPLTLDASERISVQGVSFSVFRL